MEHERKRSRLTKLIGGSVVVFTLMIGVSMIHGGEVLASLWPISPHVVSDRARKHTIVRVK